ncbi:hypothetical protein BCR32DRAFT_285809 [Anaeromyces robustus]|uniref:FLYWCH-type domain-containing protein n=1 Tax=Anaeromyces robustus TaxID=1754192 RepID=A0A1Y1WDV7_9FUNG|nr:hypothetical protein BCR32DRAFT_285809 [Anaeromyces robustus]|eukprot:ORX71710.1 hypothetical protein BCR32DRAFT_285809 [Anaeromyces robustus]
MEENIEIEISETNRGNEQIIINRKYKFNLSSKRKDNSKIYKCTEYKTMNRCKSFIILNDKYEIVKYDSSHNHLEKKYEATTSLYWNYYNNIKHITNNASESYNNQLKSIFSKKPTFFKLIYVLQKQEFLSNIDYQRRIAGYWEKKPKKLIRTDEINAIVKYYKIMEILEKRKNEIDRNKITNLWLDCLDDLLKLLINN